MQFLDREQEIRTGPEFFNELEGRAHHIERRNLQNPWIGKVDNTLVLILLQQRFKHGAGLRAVLREYIPLADVIRTLAARERRLIESDVAD